jgi:superfamily II DNA or RNA helicase
MELRKHQIEALEALEKYNEGIVHLPTGAGKTMIESYAIINNIEKGFELFEIPVFVVLAPRIILCNQLYTVVKDMLLSQNKDCQYLIVHSGKTVDNTKRMWTATLPFRDLLLTTSSKDIKSEYNKALEEKVPLVIFGTYDSCERIVNAGVPVYMTLCDEAHYLVSEEFNWISKENEENIVKQFNSTRKYYFTATLKETISDNSLGMNNSNLFGPIIYEKTPLEMITAGEILKPRMHLVDINNSYAENIGEINADVNAIINSFIEHRVHCNIGAKMLVVTKGSEHLNDITRHPKMQNLLEIRPGLKIFDISSAYMPRINGETVKREKFLESLQNLSDTDEAIIFHINILSEGIDVPGITGIMPMNMMGTGKFLQTLGRPSRLHKKDREKLYAGIMKYNESDKFIKPYAWILVPTYGIIGDDLRDYGFNAAEDVVIKESKGKTIPIPLGGVNETDKRGVALFDLFVDVEHTIEEKAAADKLAVEDFRLEESIKSLSDEELVKF